MESSRVKSDGTKNRKKGPIIQAEKVQAREAGDQRGLKIA